MHRLSPKTCFSAQKHGSRPDNTVLLSTKQTRARKHTAAQEAYKNFPRKCRTAQKQIRLRQIELNLSPKTCRLTTNCTEFQPKNMQVYDKLY